MDDFEQMKKIVKQAYDRIQINRTNFILCAHGLLHFHFGILWLKKGFFLFYNL